jgi:hypothetical protein
VPKLFLAALGVVGGANGVVVATLRNRGPHALAAQLVDLEVTPFDALVVAVSNLQITATPGSCAARTPYWTRPWCSLDILERALLWPSIGWLTPASEIAWQGTISK